MTSARVMRRGAVMLAGLSAGLLGVVHPTDLPSESARGTDRAAGWIALGPRVACAQSSQRAEVREALADAATFRAVFGRTLYANVRSDEIDAIAFRARIGADGIQLETGGGTLTVATEDTDAPWPLRLVAAFLATQPLTASMEALGAPLAESLVGWDVHSGVSPPVPARRVGTDVASALLAYGTSEPLALRVRRSDGIWTVETLSWLTSANGWIPGRIRVARDGRAELELEILDAATSPEGLAPLVARPAAAPSAPPLRLPRLAL